MILSNEEILKKLKVHFDNNHIKLPGSIDFSVVGQSILIRLSVINLRGENNPKANMQTDENAFEGWAFAVHVATGLNISLGIKDDKPLVYDYTKDNGHLGRFLYRVMKFKEQYSWFSIYGDGFNETVSKFENFIKDKKNTFINNLGSGEAGTKTDHNKENEIEEKLTRPGMIGKVLGRDFKENGVFRQFKVGLFCENHRIFTGGQSAIDLWTWNDNDFVVIELKRDNIMIGIITEIFFYSNYMRDLLFDDGIFTLNEAINEVDRGYSNILTYKDNFKTISGVMLADEYHPLINDDIIDAMNAGNEDKIEYKKASYNPEELMKTN